MNNTEFVSNVDNPFFSGEINFKIKDSESLYKFFQTNKKYRKKIEEIKLTFKVNLFDNLYSIENLMIDNKSNDQINNLIKYYNKNNFNDQDFTQEDDFEFNQDFGEDEDYRSPGWLRYQKRIK